MADQACDFSGREGERERMEQCAARHTESDAIQREGGFCVRSLFLHSDNLIEGAANRARRWLVTEGGGGDDLTSGAPVAGVFAVATGDIFAVEQVVDVDADRRSRQAKARQIVFHRRIHQRITGHTKGIIFLTGRRNSNKNH